MGDKSIGRAAIEKIELAWQADPNKFRVDKKKKPAHLFLSAGWALVRTEIHCRRAAELPRSRDFWW